MLANSNLPAEDDVVLNGDAAGEPGLRRDDNVFSDAAVVSDVHEIVDLGAASDARFIQRSAVDGRVGPDFHVIFDHQFSDLRKFLVVAALAISHIAEAVSANSPAMTAPAPDRNAFSRYLASSTNTRSSPDAEAILPTPPTWTVPSPRSRAPTACATSCRERLMLSTV